MSTQLPHLNTAEVQWNTQFSGKSVIYLHSKIHIPSSTGSLDITVKLKAEWRFCTSAVLLLTFYTEITLTKVELFTSDISWNVVSRLYTRWCQSCSQLRSLDVCYAIITNCRKLRKYDTEVKYVVWPTLLMKGKEARDWAKHIN